MFFVKQKTAYEMRISDWSSDVCSSDLCRNADGGAHFGHILQHHGIRSDPGIAADLDRAENGRIGADDHAVPQRRMPLARNQRRTAQRHPLVKGARKSVV